MYFDENPGAGTPEVRDVAGGVLAEVHPKLKELYLDVWQLAHDRSLPLEAQGIAKAWLGKMGLVFEARVMRFPGHAVGRRAG